MGICYSEVEEWEDYNQKYRRKRRNRRKKQENSVIYEEKSSFESSFTSKVCSSFRDDIHKTLSNINGELESVVMGSIVEMTDKELKALEKSLTQFSEEGQDFNHEELITFCNLKTKNFLHTHKIRHPHNQKVNQISACPYTSAHIIEYDLWKLIPNKDNDSYYIYHPFTQKFVSLINQRDICCSDEKYEWKVRDYGRRRNGGFIKLMAYSGSLYLGDLCMNDGQGLLPNHRKLNLCDQKHIGHLWQINFGQCIQQ